MKVLDVRFINGSMKTGIVWIILFFFARFLLLSLYTGMSATCFVFY